MRIPGLTRESIEANAEPGSVQRGEEYFKDGAVKALRRTADDEVEAYVQGSDIAPYHVQVRHDTDGITDAECTCPYVEGAWCRHIVATLLAVLDSNGQEGEISLNRMLDDLDRVQLIHLIERLSEAFPGLIDVVESEHRRRG